MEPSSSSKSVGPRNKKKPGLILTVKLKGVKIYLSCFRSTGRKAGLMFKIRQTFSAFLTVLPATVAVTYILSTGDPVGAAGIKVKLTGLFGMKVLYALVAIPATTGLKKADQKQLEALLAPITQTWLGDKLNTIQALFKEEVTGGIFAAADQALEKSAKLIDDVEQTLNRM